MKVPGVQVPFAAIKAELVFETPGAPGWIGFSDAIFVPNQAGNGLNVSIHAGRKRSSASRSRTEEAVRRTGSAFTALWTANCGDGTLARIDAKTYNVAAAIASGTGSAGRLIAATADSIWVLSDARGTLSRIDPQEKAVVAEFRVPADCASLTSGESALWLACPAENRVLRIDPAGNLVEKSIEVSAQPEALAIGESSVWVLCAKEGKVERVDPKTNKVSKTISSALRHRAAA